MVWFICCTRPVVEVTGTGPKNVYRLKIHLLDANWTHAILGLFGSNGSFWLTGLMPFLVHLVQMVHFCCPKIRKIFKIK